MPCGHEAGITEDPDHTPPKKLWTSTVDPLNASDKLIGFTLHFEKGIPVKIGSPHDTVTDSLELFKALNNIGHDHGVGRIVS